LNGQDSVGACIIDHFYQKELENDKSQQEEKDLKE